MKKQIIILILLTLFAVNGKSQWTHHRTINYGPTYPPSVPLEYTFSGIGYASMNYGIYGVTIWSHQSQTRSMGVCKIDEINDTITTVRNMSAYGVNAGAMITEKKLGKVFHFGNYQSYPVNDYLDSTGNFIAIGIHPQGYSLCFSAFDLNHIYSIFTNEFGEHIFFTKIYEVGAIVDTFTTFAPQKIDFPYTNCGYMSIVENGINTNKILKSSQDLLTWETIYETSNTISDILFDEVNTGYAIVQPGMIIKTKDGGISWDTIYNASDKILNKIDVVNEEIIFACGNNGVVLRSINGGLEWSQDTFPSTLNLDQIVMFDEENGYAISKNIIYRLKTPDPIYPPDTNTVKNVIMWPNPNSGDLEIKALYVINSIEVLDLSGKVVYTEVTNGKEINVKYFPNVQGIFVIKVTFDNGKSEAEEILFIR